MSTTAERYAWDTTEFPLIAGAKAVSEQRAKQAELMEQGYSLAQAQERTTHIVGAELVRSMYGWSIRYDSGLQGWALIYRSRMPHEESRSFSDEFADFRKVCGLAHDWVSADPKHRYAWVRRSSLQQYGLL